VIRIDPDPPVAGKDGVSAVACNAHLLVVGAVIVSVCEDPHADATSAARANVDAVSNLGTRDRTVTTVIGCV